MLLWPPTPSQGIPRGLDKSKHSSWLGLPTMLQNNVDKLVTKEASNSRNEGTEKKGRNLFWVPSMGEGGRLKSTDLSTPKIVT